MFMFVVTMMFVMFLVSSRGIHDSTDGEEGCKDYSNKENC